MLLTAKQVEALWEISDGSAPIDLRGREHDGAYLVSRPEDGLVVLVNQNGDITHVGGPVTAFEKIGEET